ncbi:hypothetical protein [Aureimonas leprariae]|uniref:Periplasmic protein-like protein n=1 Tax=Plantimonas leprariae TaxID=2615207 RepID=A0A7V7PQU1_9HYPH|nr:hypothetical protein [Aureimonas leprariae]KAB0680796.1 hypothetical protein F6X38_07335 [Aureimonas leprariae]
MVGDEYSPGAVERLFRRIPDGAILRAVFFVLLALAVGVIGQDYRTMALADADRARTERTEPLPLAPPKPGDQIRPFLPRTIPVAPDRGEPRLPGYDAPAATAAMSQPMQFRMAADRAATAVGRIDVGTAEAFGAFLDGEGRGVKSLILHSPGGSVEDAMAMARLARERKLEMLVPADGYCASACPLFFAGGRYRAAGDHAWIGLHQVYAVDVPGVPRMRDLDRSISDIQATVARCQQLLQEMGVKPDIWIKAMQTPPNDLYVLTPDELSISNYVTKPVQGPPMPPTSTSPERPSAA